MFLRKLLNVLTALLMLLAATAVTLMLYRRPRPMEFRQPNDALPVRLPRDAAVHYDTHTEWWYYTGFLTDEQHREYGFELVFYRVFMPESKKVAGIIPLHWLTNPHYFAQFAVSDRQTSRHEMFEQNNRWRFWLNHARSDRFDVQLGPWHVTGEGGNHQLTVAAGQYKLQLELESAKPPVFHGEAQAGVIEMGRAGPSYYYSYTDLKGNGVLEIDGQSHAVRASVWMDHQWGSWHPEVGFSGWDWFSLRFDNGCQAMLFDFRDEQQRRQNESSGTWIGADGQATHLFSSDFHVEVLRRWTNPDTGNTYPVQWSIGIPRFGVDIVAEAAFDAQEMVLAEEKNYWEGMVDLSGSVGGRGYVELAGYDKSANPSQ